LQRPFGAAADLGRGDILGCEEAAGPLGFGGFFPYRGPPALPPSLGHVFGRQGFPDRVSPGTGMAVNPLTQAPPEPI